jgi:hypothetical protein
LAAKIGGALNGSEMMFAAKIGASLLADNALK